MELYRKHRPKLFKELRGQPEAIKSLMTMVKNKTVPHALLLAGPAGTGKTSTALILKEKLGCHDNDFREINASESRGIDTIREMKHSIGMRPMFGSCSIWMYDECQKLSNDAQNAFLRYLEFPPDHIYFILCTTDPDKLLTTIRSRCTIINYKPVPSADLESILTDIAAKEKINLSEEVRERIIEVAEGGARRAVVLLEQIANLETDEERLQIILSSDAKAQAIDLARALIDTRKKWKDIAIILKKIEEEPERIRHLVLGYAQSVLLGGGPQADRAHLVINCFRDPFYDSKKPGLVASCRDIFVQK